MKPDQTSHRISRPARTGLLGAVLCSLLWSVGGCRETTRPLTLSRLSPTERLYVERVVAAERAKAVALVSRDVGEALLDSLAAAWGDSAVSETVRGLSGSPSRAIAFNDFLLQVVRAEQDSLLQLPGRNRLQLPLPPPATAPATPPTGG